MLSVQITYNSLTGLQEVVDLLRGDGTLKLLTMQKPGFNPLESLAGLYELLGALAVSAAVASLRNVIHDQSGLGHRSSATRQLTVIKSAIPALSLLKVVACEPGKNLIEIS